LELQYDYLTAYFDFFNPSGPTVALKIAKKYKTYPILKKRKLFEEIEEQVFEATPNTKPEHELGKENQIPVREMTNLAATEPSLDFSVESKKIDIRYQNMRSCTVNFYGMDLELLFSTSPFLSEGDSKFLFVSPNFSLNVDLPEGVSSMIVDLPKQFHNANVFVEVVGQGHGVSRVQPYYSHSLSVQVIENYG